MELPALVEWINRQHGTSFALGGRIGVAHGAWLLQDAGGAKAVLKRGPSLAYEVRRRVWERALGIRGPAEVVICMISSLIGMVEWSARHQRAKDVDCFIETGHRFLEDLSSKKAE